MAGHPTTFMPLAAGYPALMGHHRHLLDDRVRTQAFRRAIAKIVKRGHVVADLGTGTGVLAMEARRRGAAAVYAIERDPIVHVAAAIAKHNAIDGIQWIARHSREVTLPEDVDLIVSECFGVLAVGGTMLEAVCDLRARHLRPEGRVSPESVSLFAAPVHAPRDHAYVDVWKRKRYGLDFAPARAFAFNQPYNTTFEPGALLASPARLGRIDLARDDYRGRFEGRARFVARAGTLHGFAAWFTADLGAGVTLSTAPGRASTIWRQVYFPLEPAKVRARTPIEVALDYEGGHFAWRGAIGDRVFSHDTRASFPGAVR